MGQPGAVGDTQMLVSLGPTQLGPPPWDLEHNLGATEAVLGTLGKTGARWDNLGTV